MQLPNKKTALVPSLDQVEGKTRTFRVIVGKCEARNCGVSLVNDDEDKLTEFHEAIQSVIVFIQLSTQERHKGLDIANLHDVGHQERLWQLLAGERRYTLQKAPVRSCGFLPPRIPHLDTKRRTAGGGGDRVGASRETFSI
jgi:hypothetical protein